MPRQNVIQVVIGADDRTQGAFESATRNAAKFGAVMTAALGGSVAVAAQFEQGLAEIQTLLGKGATPEIAKMRKELLELSKQSGQTLGTLTKARYDIISAGFTDAAASAKVLEASVQIARGGLVDAGIAADLMTTAINGMGLAADDASDVADDLFTIVKLGKTTMGELATSLGQVFATAKTAGVSLDEVGAAMAVATAAGIDTARSATSLNQLMLALAAPTDEARKQLEALGISLDQGLSAAMVQLSLVSADGLDQLREIIPSVEALRVAAAVANNMDKFNVALAEMGDNSGAAQEAVDIMSQTLIEQLKELRQAAIVFAEGIGSQLLPQVKALVERATGLVDAFDKLPDGVKQVGVQAAVAATGVLVLAAAFGQLALSLNGALVGLSALRGSAALRTLAGLAGGVSAAGLTAAGVAGAAAVGGGALLFGGSTGEATRDLTRPAGQNTSGGRIPIPGQRLPADILGYVNSFGAPAGGGAVAAAVGGTTAPARPAMTPEQLEELIRRDLLATGGLLPQNAPQNAYDAIVNRQAPGAVGIGAEAIEADAVPRMAEGLGSMGESMARLVEGFRAIGETMAEFSLVESTWAFSDAVGQAIVYGEEFGQVFVNALKRIAAQLISTIIQFVALQVVVKGLLNLVGLGGFGSLLGLAQGSMSVPGPRLAAQGFAHVPSGGGLDRVPVLLRGGETVMSPDRANMLRSALYQPQQGRPSLIDRWRQRTNQAGGFVVGVKDSFTGSEAVDFADILERAAYASEGLR